ncbi:MAG: hypothetical protein OXT09_25505, partial [Myxococcales bacterium]|nr:hypothetical protein [Myxococcales bacterium]
MNPAMHHFGLGTPRDTTLRVLVGASMLVAIGCGEEGPRAADVEEPPAMDDGAAGSAADEIEQLAADPWLDDGADPWDAQREPPPEPASEALAGFVANTVQWSGMLVSTTGAHVLVGHEDTIAYAYRDFFLEPVLDPYETYLRVELELSNVGATEIDYVERDTWDLVLRDGTRIQSQDLLDVSVLPGDTAATVLHYALPLDTDLAGASIVLEGATYASLNPETIALDAQVERRFPRRIDSLVGMVFEDDDVRVEVDEAMWDSNHALLGRPRAGSRSVWLRLAVTMPADNSEHWSGSEVRLSIDGRSQAPRESDHGIVHELETRVFAIFFEIEQEADAATVLIPMDTSPGSEVYA